MRKIGRYEVVEELGRGAMGVVYKASDPTIGRMVAIKVLLIDDKPEEGVPSTRDIFLREARAAGRLSHPGIVTIHDALEDETTRTSYIVMEYIPGRTLEKILISTPQIGADKALDIIRQVAEGLDYAHRNQIIHRDLKPANIILTEDGRAKITDFGIAKIAAQGAMRTVAIMGTPSYMSPEQVTGGEIDARADIFSMGILLYLMLVGEKPFGGDTAAVMFKIVYEDPVLPSRVNPKLTAADDYVVLRCLAKDRAKRYASAREFLDDLEDLRQGRPPRSQARVPPSEIQAAERTIAVLHPLIPPPPPSGVAPAPPPAPPVAQPPVAMPVTPPPVAVPVPTPAPVSIPVAAPAVPVAAAPRAPAKKKSSAQVVGALAAVLVAVLAGAGIWMSRQSSAPPSPGIQRAPQATAPALPPGTESTANPDTSASPNKPVAEMPPPTVEAKSSPGKRPPVRVKGAPPPSKPPDAATAAPEPAPATVAAAQPAPTPAETAATATKLAPIREITVYCKHEYEDATLLLLDGNKTVYQARLLGKKKRGFIGIGGKGFSGVLTATVTVPGDAQELTVRVYSSDGAVNVQQRIAAHSPSDDFTTLRVTPAKELLKLEWAKTKASGK
jgi:serine/threonine-protein kinase